MRVALVRHNWDLLRRLRQVARIGRGFLVEPEHRTGLHAIVSDRHRLRGLPVELEVIRQVGQGSLQCVHAVDRVRE